MTMAPTKVAALPKKKPSPPAKKAVKPARTSAERMTLAAAMATLEKAGSAQTRKIYARHGAKEPMFGVSFATLKTLVKKIRVDHDLALALWGTGNHDARILAFKIADPQRMTSADLDRWAGEPMARGCSSYLGGLTAEGPLAAKKAEQWLAAPPGARRTNGWVLLGQLAMLDEAIADAWFGQRIEAIEKAIHSAPNADKGAMNAALIAIGCRNPALRKAATAAAKRIGKVEVDHGDTECKTPDAAASIDKTWTHSTAKGFASPAAHERSREPMRIRC